MTESSNQTLKGLPIKSKSGLYIGVVVLAILCATWSTRSFGQFDATHIIIDDETLPEKATIKPEYEEPLNMAMVEQKPQFPGGDAEMYKWIGENLNYPALAQEDGIQGKVFIQFVVEKDGSLTNIKVTRGKHPTLDAEAIRLVRSMPRWKPGRIKGLPVRVTYILTVAFKLE